MPSTFAAEGFIHCSRAHQLSQVLDTHFAGQSDLVLLEIDPSRLNCPVVDENLTGGSELYPHIYGPLPMESVTSIRDLTCDVDGRFSLPCTVARVTNLQIARAERNDAPTILALQRAAYESEARRYNDWNIPPMTETLEALVAAFATSTVLKGVIDDRIVGSVRATMTGTTCDIGRLIVHPNLQRRGIGRRLMHAIEQAHPLAQRFELFTGSLSTGEPGTL